MRSPEFEEWRPLPADEGRGWYEVSSLGRIRSWRQPGPGRYLRAFPKILSPTPNHHGYFVFTFRKDGLQKAVNVHREVCRAFHGEPAEGLYARHLDGDSFNNVASNLAWGTPQDNVDDRERHTAERAARAA